MIHLISQTEAVPASYPDRPAGLSAAAAALDPDAIWARIEAYVAYRWTEREVVWIVEGQGGWCPNLAPVSVTTEQIWQDNAWAEATVYAWPYGGYRLPVSGTYRFTGNVGAGVTVPAEVNEGFRRLAEYLVAEERHPGASSYTDDVGPITLSRTRAPTWRAKALQYSGAADLLRPYRRSS